MTAIFLTDEQVDLIRRTLITVLEMRGGDLDDDTDEPGLPDEIAQLEERTREAIQVLDRAGAAGI